MKRSIWHIVILFFSLQAFAQTSRVDSLRQILPHSEDTLRASLLNRIGEELTRSLSSFPAPKKDSFLHIAKRSVTEAAELSQKLGYDRGTGIALYLSGVIAADSSVHNQS